MSKLPSAADVPGYIYTFEIRGEFRPSVPHSTRGPIGLPQMSLIRTKSISKSDARSTSRNGWTNGINSAEQSRGNTSFADGGLAPLKIAATLQTAAAFSKGRLLQEGRERIVID